MLELIPGGLASGMRPSDFDPAALRRGTKVEMEHTGDRRVAQEIAMDHLVEDPRYYEKLATIEGHHHMNDNAQYIKNVLVPLSASDKDFQGNPDMKDVWAAVAAVAMGASAYHGYKRNEPGGNPVAWALWWGFWGALIPIITVPVALAQGFAEPAE
jgi:hypothetical protein